MVRSTNFLLAQFMSQKTAAKSALGMCGDLPIEAKLAEADGLGREEIVARLTHEIGCLNSALPSASPALKKEMVLLVECLCAARQVVERSVSFRNAHD
ncbi:hypothetical protein BCh11DRAFT_00027 [Burkholderia sp. Ch1-1]|nr:hypothetical protein BCh11DRAFT_00027 [Burkholderia sp. Ch1-1]